MQIYKNQIKSGCLCCHCVFIKHVVKLPFCDVLYLYLLYCYSWEFGKVLIKEITQIRKYVIFIFICPITHSIIYVADLVLHFQEPHGKYRFSLYLAYGHQMPDTETQIRDPTVRKCPSSDIWFQ